MEALKPIILGIIQGISEFLPISSSGHITVVYHFFELIEDNLQFNVIVHLATLLSIFTVMRRVLIKTFLLIVQDLKALNFNGTGSKFLYKIILATIPVGLVGVLFKDYIEGLFNNINFVAVCFLITGAFLLATKFIKKTNPVRELEHNISFKQAIIVGLFQALAIMPGISRSGVTISAGMFTGMNGLASAYFSFILSIPAIIGAFLVESKDIFTQSTNFGFLILGFVSAYIAGVIGLTLVLKVANKKKLDYFSPYLFLLGTLLLIYY